MEALKLMEMNHTERVSVCLTKSVEPGGKLRLIAVPHHDYITPGDILELTSGELVKVVLISDMMSDDEIDGMDNALGGSLTLKMAVAKMRRHELSWPDMKGGAADE